jgi:hypothetical protein
MISLENAGYAVRYFCKVAVPTSCSIENDSSTSSRDA